MKKLDDKDAELGELLQAQCWEDAETLRAGLGTSPGETVVSIASGGDNSLALLLDDPGKVIAVDPNPAQIACCRLKTAAYKKLGYGEFLELFGSRSGNDRAELLVEVLKVADADTAAAWSSIGVSGINGIGATGSFERQWSRFRRKRLPFAAGKVKIDALFAAKSEADRARFFDQVWNSRRWRGLYRGALGRALAVVDGDSTESPRIDGAIMDQVSARLRNQMVDQDPAGNPYLNWILRGDHGDTLPVSLRARHFNLIRERLDRVEWQARSLEGALGMLAAGSVDRFNLGSLFETTSEAAYQHLLKSILRASRKGARLVYWNTLVERSRPDSLSDRLRPMTELAERLTATDRTLFGQKLIIEEVI